MGELHPNFHYLTTLSITIKWRKCPLLPYFPALASFSHYAQGMKNELTGGKGVEHISEVLSAPHWCIRVTCL